MRRLNVNAGKRVTLLEPDELEELQWTQFKLFCLELAYELVQSPHFLHYSEVMKNEARHSHY